MSYIRIIPQDLFNEANLLKCLGRLYIALENTPNHKARFDVEDVDHFDVRQDPNDGSIYVANLPFSIDGLNWHLSRPLNSRETWPLYANPTIAHLVRRETYEVAGVFTAEGNLSAEFLRLIQRKPVSSN